MLQSIRKTTLPGAAIVAAAITLFVSSRAEAQYSSPTRIVRNEENPARSAFAVTLAPPVIAGLSTATYTVPGGKQLVVEFVAARVQGDPAFSYPTKITGTTNGSTNEFYIPVAQQYGTQTYLAAMPAKLYFDPGTNVTVTVTNAVFAQQPITVVVTLSGHTVTVP